jgi:hypothetical protein
MHYLLSGLKHRWRSGRVLDVSKKIKMKYSWPKAMGENTTNSLRKER